MMKRIITEVVAENVNSALNAERAGADRIELCQGFIGRRSYTFAGIYKMVLR